MPLIDAQRAMRLVRSKADQFNIDTDKIGTIGFFAGGRLAATLATHFDENVYEPIDEADTLSARPDFMALLYPVISFVNDNRHTGLYNNFLGENPKQEMLSRFSNELYVISEIPPTLLVHATDEGGVSVENSLILYQALRDN